MPLTLRNPHSVLAALRARPGAVRSVSVGPKPGGAWAEVADACREAGVRVTAAAGGGGNRGGRRGKGADDRRTAAGEAVVDEPPCVPPADLFADVDPNAFALWLALDRVQDPHNLGAVLRAAAFFGVRGAVLTRDQSAPLSAVAVDTACGGADAVPLARPANLAAALAAAKDAGLWVLGTTEHAAVSPDDRSDGPPVTTVAEVPRDRPWLLVVGNEERGLRRRTLGLCDHLCRLPPADPHGPVTSLNVSVAAGAVLAVLGSRGRRTEWE